MIWQLGFAGEANTSQRLMPETVIGTDNWGRSGALLRQMLLTSEPSENISNLQLAKRIIGTP